MTNEFPAGAIENGREHLRRLTDFYAFECEGGPLENNTDFQEAVRCFEHIAEWADAAEARLREARDRAEWVGREAWDLGYEHGSVLVCKDPMKCRDGEVAWLLDRSTPALDTRGENPNWVWYGEDEDGKYHVSLGRWQKHPCQMRYKLADIQPTEHDHPSDTRGEDVAARERGTTPEITDADEAKARLLSGERIFYSQDGEVAWFSADDHPRVSHDTVWAMRNNGWLKRVGYAGGWDEASDKLRDLAALTERGDG